VKGSVTSRASRCFGKRCEPAADGGLIDARILVSAHAHHEGDPRPVLNGRLSAVMR
jgi:hypothetical protein